MTRRIILIGLLLLLLWLTGKPTPPPAIAQSPASEIIQLVNNFRVANGLPAFQINNSLMIAAQQQANFMAANNIYSHTGAGGSSPQSRAEAAGYVVVHFTWRSVTTAPDRVVAQIRAAVHQWAPHLVAPG